MLSPLSLDLAAQDIVRERVRQAAHAALVNQLRAAASDARRARSASDASLRAASEARFAWAHTLAVALAPRQRLADGLRALACRLDPAIGCCDPPLAVLKVR